MQLRAFTIGIEFDDAIQIAENIYIRVRNALPSIPDVVGGVLRVADGGAADVGFWDDAIEVQIVDVEPGNPMCWLLACVK